MANSMRMVWDNAADRSTLAANSVVLPVANLQTDSKTDVWRSASFSNLLLAPDDLTDASWVKRGTCAITANQAVGPNGTQIMDLVSGLTSGGTNDFYQGNFVSTAASVRVEPEFYIRRISTSGTVGVGSATGSTYGLWSINLSLLSSNLEHITRTHPAVTIVNEWVADSSGNTGINIYSISGSLSMYLSGLTVSRQDVGILSSFTSLENVSCVSLPYCNFSPTASFRIRKTDEIALTNSLNYSEQLSATGWTNTAVSITANAAIAPDGTLTADKMFGDGTSAAHSMYRTVTILPLTTYTISIFAKAVENAWMYLAMDGVGAGGYSTFNISTGQLGSLTSGITSRSISAVSSSPGWYRVSITFTTGASAGTNQFHFSTSATDTIGATTTTGGAYYWGGMVSLGGLTSYYPSDSSLGVRPLGYIDQWQSYTQDSGYVLAHGSTAVKVAGLTSTQASSAYQYGGGVAATSYTASIPCYGVRVDIIDTANLQGYIEAARLVIGDYFSPVYDAEIGAKISYEDTGKNFRNDAGNLMSDIGNRYKSIDFNLGALQEVDRAAIWKIVSYCGTSYPVFMSLYPGNTNKDLEQAHTVYGKFSSATKMASKAYGVYEAPLTIEGI